MPLVMGLLQKHLSAEHLPPGKEKKSRRFWECQAECRQKFLSLCPWVEMHRNLGKEKNQPPPFFGKKEIAP